jgi:hypothetical protein
MKHIQADKNKIKTAFILSHLNNTPQSFKRLIENLLCQSLYNKSSYL